MRSLAIGILTAAVSATSAIAGAPDVSKEKNPVPPELVPCFRDHEFQIDIFGSYMNKPHTDRLEELGLEEGVNGGGGGVGLNYFFSPNIGLGVDGSINSNLHGIWDYTGKLIIRFPIENGRLCIAPYIFGGGGGQSYEHIYRTAAAWMCGAGLEWRATPHLGIFAEGRYTWTSGGGERHDEGLRAENGGDNAQARLGVRIAF